LQNEVGAIWPVRYADIFDPLRNDRYGENPYRHTGASIGFMVGTGRRRQKSSICEHLSGVILGKSAQEFKDHPTSRTTFAKEHLWSFVLSPTIERWAGL